MVIVIIFVNIYRFLLLLLLILLLLLLFLLLLLLLLLFFCSLLSSPIQCLFIYFTFILMSFFIIIFGNASSETAKTYGKQLTSYLQVTGSWLSEIKIKSWTTGISFLVNGNNFSMQYLYKTISDNDNSICCDKCNWWVRIKCNNLSFIDYQYLNKMMTLTFALNVTLSYFHLVH